METLLLITIASSVCLSGVSKGENHHNHKVLNVGKPSKNKVKLRHPSAKRGPSPKPFSRSHEEAYHYVIETSYRNHNDDPKKKRKQKDLKIPTKDYQNDEWENKCSSLKGGTNKKQFDIPGCGGWVKLACPGGCLAIHKV